MSRLTPPDKPNFNPPTRRLSRMAREKKTRSAIKDVISREYTINLHKVTHFTHSDIYTFGHFTFWHFDFLTFSIFCHFNFWWLKLYLQVRTNLIISHPISPGKGRIFVQCINLFVQNSVHWLAGNSWTNMHLFPSENIIWWECILPYHTCIFSLHVYCYLSDV